MQATGSKPANEPYRTPGSATRRMMDGNGARTWLWAAIGLAVIWALAMFYLPF